MPAPQSWSLRGSSVPDSGLAYLLWCPAVPLRITWPLTLTSTMFFGISVYAMICAHRHADNSLRVPGDRDLTLFALSVVEGLLATVSVGHWIDAKTGWRCAADKLVAHASFAAFTLVGIARVRDVHLCVLGWPIWLLMVRCYRMGMHYWSVDGPMSCRWVAAHAGFHVCGAIGKIMVIYGARQ